MEQWGQLPHLDTISSGFFKTLGTCTWDDPKQWVFTTDEPMGTCQEPGLMEHYTVTLDYSNTGHGSLDHPLSRYPVPIRRSVMFHIFSQADVVLA